MEKHWFQIMIEYTNRDMYTYEAEEFEKIRKDEDGDFIILLQGMIDTYGFYESEDINAEDIYNYDIIAEIFLHKDETIKNIRMLDTATGQEYDLNYEMIDVYYNKNSNGEELNKINIIDILGEKFINESTGG